MRPPSASPFVFGKIVQGLDFVNRDTEIRHLKTNFISLINTTLISHRRWGKSSLVHRASALAKKADKKLRVCHIDLFQTRKPEEFYEVLIREVFKKTNSRQEELIKSIGQFFKKIVPRFSFSPMPESEINFSLQWEDIQRHQDELLNMVEKIAIAKDLRIVVCIDEFQNIGFFDDPLAFQKILRASWQKHQHVAYCLYGSKQHMMMEVFSGKSMPFYKFGDIMFLEKIKESHWVKYIVKKFKSTGKSIPKEAAQLITELVHCHSNYVQQLAHLCWLNTYDECSEKIIVSALDNLLRQLGTIYQKITDDLSNTQVNYLKAVIYKEKKLSRQAVLKNYKLGTSANVAKIKSVMKDKEILSYETKQIEFIDPAYRHWLEQYFFCIKSNIRNQGA